MNDIMNYLDEVLGNQIEYMPFGDMEDVERLVKDIFMYKLGKVYKHADGDPGRGKDLRIGFDTFAKSPLLEKGMDTIAVDTVESNLTGEDIEIWKLLNKVGLLKVEVN